MRPLCYEYIGGPVPRFLDTMDAQWGVSALSASRGSGRHRDGPLARLLERNAMASFEFFAGIDWGSETLTKSASLTTTARRWANGPSGTAAPDSRR